MLRQRVITAVVLLLVLVPAMLYADPRPFMALTLLLLAAAGWEWARLNGWHGAGAIGLGASCILACAVPWALGWALSPPSWVWLMASGAWVLLVCIVLARGSDAWGSIPAWLRLLLGPVILVVAWLALVQARALGVNFLLSALLLVWAADIFAYFAGRAFGRRKLAPTISPGKSWEGVWGGLIGVLVLAACWVALDDRWQPASHSLYTQLAGGGPLLMAISLVYLVAMSVTGDLFESLVKRSAGMKDSSGLLPGHGGVLDRIDALLPVLPSVMMLTSVGVFS